MVRDAGEWVADMAGTGQKKLDGYIKSFEKTSVGDNVVGHLAGGIVSGLGSLVTGTVGLVGGAAELADADVRAKFGQTVETIVSNPGAVASTVGGKIASAWKEDKAHFVGQVVANLIPAGAALRAATGARAVGAVEATGKAVASAASEVAVATGEASVAAGSAEVVVVASASGTAGASVAAGTAGTAGAAGASSAAVAAEMLGTRAGMATAGAAREAFSVGSSVSVVRSSGAIESGWQVLEQVGNKVLVGKGNLSKSISKLELYGSNPELLPRNVPLAIQRSSGAVEDGWRVVGAGREPGLVELTNGQGLSKTVKAEELVQRNASRLESAANEAQSAERASARAAHEAQAAVRQVKVAPGPATDQAMGFARTNRIGPKEKILDGYFDGGRANRVGADGVVTSANREIIVVDRARDAALRQHLEFAKSLRRLPEKERAQQLSKYVDNLMNPKHGEDPVAAVEKWEATRLSKEVLLGDVSQLGAGVCRHRSLLFKVLGDEAGLEVSLVRGNMRSGNGFGGHAWNEVRFSSGETSIMDVMNPQQNHVPLSLRDASDAYRDATNAPIYPAR